MKKIGKQTIQFDAPPTILECASIVGPKEAQGPLSKYFDQTLDDEFWGEKTWEKAESKIIKETVNTVINKSGIPSDKIDFCFAGDLLNQCISSSFGLRELNIPFFGVFGACSTFVESMCLGAMCVESFAENVLCATSIHFCGGRICRPVHRPGLQSFRHSGKAIPFSFGIRKSTTSFCSMDCYWFWGYYFD